MSQNKIRTKYLYEIMYTKNSIISATYNIYKYFLHFNYDACKRHIKNIKYVTHCSTVSHQVIHG